MNIKAPSVVCFGEVLWDNLPSGKMPGGAPMNVAYHLKKMGFSSHIISRVGQDEIGKKLLQVVKSLNLSTDFCQIDAKYPTSTVEVNLGKNNEVEYDIVFPVAWDFIEFEEKQIELVSKADAFVFGSLASRNSQSRETLTQLLNMAPYKVFDVNLRSPHYSKEFLQLLLHKTDLLKLNAAELAIIANWYSLSAKTEEEQIDALSIALNISEIILTKGSNGATFYNKGAVINCPAFNVKVLDTVGSGDSFLAGFLSQKIINKTDMESLRFASVLAAFVTASHGACPAYHLPELENFVKQLLLKAN